MAFSHPSRRDFLALSGTAAAAWLGVDPAALGRALEAARAAVGLQSPVFQNLTVRDAADLEAIAAHIIPTDDLPGAREARVIVFLDRIVGEQTEQQHKLLFEGLQDLNRRAAERAGRPARFAQLADAEQHALLSQIEHGDFFQQVRGATIIGMFAHPQWGGNHEGAGYAVLGFEPRFLWQPPFGAYDAEVSR